MEISNDLKLYLAIGITAATTTLASWGAHAWMENAYGKNSHAKDYARLWGGLAGLVIGVNAAGGLARSYFWGDDEDEEISISQKRAPKKEVARLYDRVIIRRDDASASENDPGVDGGLPI